jgi:hypothetical protein
MGDLLRNALFMDRNLPAAKLQSQSMAALFGLSGDVDCRKNEDARTVVISNCRAVLDHLEGREGPGGAVIRSLARDLAGASTVGTAKKRKSSESMDCDEDPVDYYVTKCIQEEGSLSMGQPWAVMTRPLEAHGGNAVAVGVGDAVQVVVKQPGKTASESKFEHA